MTELNTSNGGKPRGRPPKKLNGSASTHHAYSVPVPTRYQRECQFEFEKWIILISAILTAVLTGLAAPELLNASSIIDWLKVFFIGASAGFVSYVVNDKALKQVLSFLLKALSWRHWQALRQSLLWEQVRRFSAIQVWS